MRAYPDRGLHGRTVREIGLRIVSGKLLPGTTLDVDEFGRELDVSRTVIREALKVLSAKGLVDARPKIGTYVRRREEWNLLDPDVLRWQFEGATDAVIFDKLAEVRSIVEPAAAALAASRRTDGDLVTLSHALDDMTDRVKLEDSAGITEADLRFHRALLAAAHNEFIEQMEAIMEAGLHARDLVVHGARVDHGPSLALHRGVVEAVRMGSVHQARDRMEQLLHHSLVDERKVLGDERKVVGDAAPA